MGRPPKAKHLRRSERFFLRLTTREMAELEQASRKLEEPVAAILRNGAAAYIRLRGKDGSRTKKEKNSDSLGKRISDRPFNLFTYFFGGRLAGVSCAPIASVTAVWRN